MELEKLSLDEHNETRALWEEVFRDDSQEFLDYYYQYKTSNNQIYVMDHKETICAMLQLNPYDLVFGNDNFTGHYIIAVATDPRYRHQGLMSQLLYRSMKDMYLKKEPFTYLMPAAEAIYTPFGFRYIYDQRQGMLEGKTHTKETGFILTTAKSEDLQGLSSYMNRYLKDRYHVYARRSEEYYSILQKELKSEDGDIILIKREDQLIGSFLYAIGEQIEVREPIIDKEYRLELYDEIANYFSDYGKKIHVAGIPEEGMLKEQELKPMIMARILHLPSFVKEIRAEEEITFTLGIEDPILEENQGMYQWIIGPKGGRITVSKESGSSLGLPIHALLSLVFGYKTIEVILEEEQLSFPEELILKLKKLLPLSKVFINEIV